MFGNGLRPQIWDLFVRRFNIKRVGEFYGATEGNSSVGNNHRNSLMTRFYLEPSNVISFSLLVNIDGKEGAVGFTSVLFPFVYPVRFLFFLLAKC